MPTYDGGNYIAEALGSIAAEGDPGIECIVVDDGSRDDTLAIVDSFASRLRLRVVEGPRRGNWVASTNRALEAASGRHVCLLHQDDAWMPGRAARVAALVEAYPAARLILHAVRFMDDRGRDVGPWRCPLPEGASSPEVTVRRLLVQNFVAIPAPVFRREDALARGGMDEGLWYTADWDLWLALATLGETVYVDEPLARFRVHADSQTVRRSTDLGAFRAQMTTVFERHAAALGAPLDESARGAAALSIAVNTLLAALAHGEPAPIADALRLGVAVGPSTWARYVAHSRIHERVGARLRARLVAQRAPRVDR